MTQERIYLDWNATAPLRPEARQAMAAAWDAGNPSSIHVEGRAARRLVEDARSAVAAAVGAEPAGVVFTSGGTEANALALSPGVTGRAGTAPVMRLLTSAVEHPSVLAGGRFAADLVGRLKVDAAGVVDLADLHRQLAAGPPALVSVMLANNETGVVQPIADIAAAVHAAGSLLHVDAIQALGRLPISIKALNADLMTLSGHKIGGPKGVGALVVRGGISLPALIAGGGQERGRRAGTENVPGIVGFGAAAAVAGAPSEIAHMLGLRRLLEQGLKEDPDLVIFSEAVERLPNTVLFGVAGLRAETAVIGFDLEGIAVSSGAACSSGKVSSSHVLAAMGVPGPLSGGAIRLSLGWTTTESEIHRVVEAWRKLSGVLGRGG